MKLCKCYLHFAASVYFLVTQFSWAQEHCPNGRKPANFVPDDDMIVVPLVIEKSVMDEFHEKHEKDFAKARKKLQHWQNEERFAENYGLEDSKTVQLPTQEQKEDFLHRHYLRFISKDFERTTNRSLQRTWETWTTDDEIDSIEMIEKHEQVLIKARKNQGKKNYGRSSSVKVGKKSFRFGVQPRLEIGMIKFTMKSDYFYARAWVGVNGNQELKVERKFKSTGTTSFVNYYIEQERMLAAVDQHLVRYWSLRLTHEKFYDEEKEISEEKTIDEDNVAQIRFSMPF